MAPGGRLLIVSSGRDRGALAAVRSLADQGWSVSFGSPDGDGMVAASRAVGTRHVVPRPRGDGRAFVDGVRDALAAGGYPVVFGGGDDWMAALSAYRQELPVTVPHPEFRVVEEALDKLALTRRAREAGLGAPRTVPATAQALRAWDGAVVVKSRRHWSHGQLGRFRVDTRLYPDLPAAAGRVAQIEQAGGEALLQEPVHGTLGSLVGLFHGGRLHARLQQESTALWPTPSGMSTRAMTVPVDEDLAARCEAMLAALGWHGLDQLQFLTDGAGSPHLIDLNGRFYGSMALATLAQPRLVDGWVRTVLGEQPPTVPDAAPGHRFSWLAGDLRRAAKERRGGRVPDVIGTLGYAVGARHSVWQGRDLGPTVHLLRERLGPLGRQPVPDPV